MGDPFDDFFGVDPEEPNDNLSPSGREEKGMSPKGQIVLGLPLSFEEIMDEAAAAEADNVIASDIDIIKVGKELGFGHDPQEVAGRFQEFAIENFDKGRTDIMAELEARTGIAYATPNDALRDTIISPEGLEPQEHANMLAQLLVKYTNEGLKTANELEQIAYHEGTPVPEKVPGSAWARTEHDFIDEVINSPVMKHGAFKVPELRSMLGLISPEAQQLNAARLYVGENASKGKVRTFRVIANIDKLSSKKTGLTNIPGLTVEDYANMVRVLAGGEKTEEAAPFSEETLAKMGDAREHMELIRNLASEEVTEEHRFSAMRAVSAIEKHASRLEEAGVAKTRQQVDVVGPILGDWNPFDADTTTGMTMTLKSIAEGINMGLGSPEFLQHAGIKLSATPEDYMKAYEEMPAGWRLSATAGEFVGMLPTVMGFQKLLVAQAVKAKGKRWLSSEATQELIKEMPEEAFKQLRIAKEMEWAAQASNKTMGLAMGIVSSTATGSRTMDPVEAAKAFGVGGAAGWISGAASTKLLQVLSAKNVGPVLKHYLMEATVEFGMNVGFALTRGEEGLTWEEIVAGAAVAMVFATKEGLGARSAQRMQDLLSGKRKPSTAREQKIMAEGTAVERVAQAAGYDNGHLGLEITEVRTQGEDSVTQAALVRDATRTEDPALLRADEGTKVEDLEFTSQISGLEEPAKITEDEFTEFFGELPDDTVAPPSSALDEGSYHLVKDLPPVDRSKSDFGDDVDVVAINDPDMPFAEYVGKFTEEDGTAYVQVRDTEGEEWFYAPDEVTGFSAGKEEPVQTTERINSEATYIADIARGNAKDDGIPLDSSYIEAALEGKGASKAVREQVYTELNSEIGKAEPALPNYDRSAIEGVLKSWDEYERSQMDPLLLREIASEYNVNPDDERALGVLLNNLGENAAEALATLTGTTKQRASQAAEASYGRGVDGFLAALGAHSPEPVSHKAKRTGRAKNLETHGVDKGGTLVGDKLIWKDESTKMWTVSSPLKSGIPDRATSANTAKELIAEVQLEGAYSPEAIKSMSPDERVALAGNRDRIDVMRTDDTTKHLTDAIDEAVNSRTEGQTRSQVKQRNLSPSGKSVLRFLDSQPSPKEMSDHLDTYSRRVNGEEPSEKFAGSTDPEDMVIDVFGPTPNGFTEGVGGNNPMHGSVMGLPGSGNNSRMPRQRLPSESANAPAPEAGSLSQLAHPGEGPIPEAPLPSQNMDGAAAPRPGAERSATGTHDITNALTDAVNVDNSNATTRIGRTAREPFGPRNAAQYDMRTHIIRLQQAGNYRAAIHEGGHAVEQKFFEDSNALADPEIIGELDALGKRLYPKGEPDRPTDTTRGWLSEGFAELMYLHHTRPKDLKKLAPKAQAKLAEWLAADKTRARKWGQVSRLVKKYNTQNPMLRLMGNIEFGRGDNGAKWRQRLLSLTPWSAASRARWIDALDPLHTITNIARERIGDIEHRDNPWIIGQVLRKSHTSVVAKMMDDGIYSPDGHVIYGKGLSSAFEIAGRENSAAFLTYLVALRGKERINHARANGDVKMKTAQGQMDLVKMTETEAQSIIDFAEAHPEYGPKFQEGATIVHGFFDGLLQYMQDWGAITPKLMEDVLKGSKHYVPLERVMDDIDFQGALGAVGGGSGPVIGRFFGSSKRFRDPAAAMIEKSVSMVRAAHQQALINSVIRLAEKIPGLGRFIEEVPVEQQRIGTKKMEDFQAQLKKEGLDLAKIQNRADMMRNDLVNMNDETLINRARQAQEMDASKGYQYGKAGYNSVPRNARGAAARQRRVPTEGRGAASAALEPGPLSMSLGSGLRNLESRTEIADYIMAVEGMPVNSIEEMQVEWFAPRITPDGTDQVVPFVDDTGTRRWFRVNPEMYKIFSSGMDHIDWRKGGIVSKIAYYTLVKPAQFFRASTTSLNPGFSLITNPLRDYLTFQIQSSHSNPLETNAQYIKHIGHAIGKDLFGDIVGMSPLEATTFFERWGGPVAARGAEAGTINFKSRARRHLVKGSDAGDLTSRVATSGILGGEIGGIVGSVVAGLPGSMAGATFGAIAGVGLSGIKHIFLKGKRLKDVPSRVTEVAGQRVTEIMNADHPVGEFFVQIADATMRAGGKVKDIAGAQQERLGVAENAPRAAEAEMSLREAGWEPGKLVTRNMMLEAMVRAKWVTVDFSAAGEWAAQLNQIIPFFNVTIQGQRALLRSFKQRPVATLLKGAMYATVPALLSYASVHDKPFWNELNPEDRYRYLFFGIGSEVIKVPLNPEIGLALTAPVILGAELLKHGDPEEFRGFIANVIETMIPGVDGGIVRGYQEIRERGEWKRALMAALPNVVIPKALVEVAGNLRSFTGRPIEGARLEGMPVDERSTAFTSGAAINIADTINASPVMIEHLMKSMGGPLVYEIAQWWAPSQAKARGSLAEGMIKRRLFSRGGTTGTHSRSFDAMMDRANWLEEQARSMMKFETNAKKREKTALAAVRTILLDKLDRARWMTDEERRVITAEVRVMSRAANAKAGKDLFFEARVKQQARAVTKQRQRDIKATRSLNSRLGSD